jgi:calmodulin
MGKLCSLLLASAEDCAAIADCLDGDGDVGVTIEEFRLMADLL